MLILAIPAIILFIALILLLTAIKLPNEEALKKEQKEREVKEFLKRNKQFQATADTYNSLETLDQWWPKNT